MSFRFISVLKIVQALRYVVKLKLLLRRKATHFHQGFLRSLALGFSLGTARGHSVKVGRNAEIILFCPQVEHCRVVDHLPKQLAGG